MQYSIEEKDLKILPNEIINIIYSYLPVRPNNYDNCMDQINYIYITSSYYHKQHCCNLLCCWDKEWDWGFYKHILSKSVKFCMQHPNWRLSLQTHKILGIR